MEDVDPVPYLVRPIQKEKNWFNNHVIGGILSGNFIESDRIILEFGWLILNLLSHTIIQVPQEWVIMADRSLNQLCVAPSFAGAGVSKLKRA